MLNKQSSSENTMVQQAPEQTHENHMLESVKEMVWALSAVIFLYHTTMIRRLVQKSSETSFMHMTSHL